LTRIEFYIQDGHKKFGESFPLIETVSLGDDTNNINSFKLLTENIREATLASTTVNFIKIMETTLEEGTMLLLLAESDDHWLIFVLV